MVRFEKVADDRLLQVFVNDGLLGHINKKGMLIINPMVVQDYVGVIGITAQDLRKISEKTTEIAKIYWDTNRSAWV